MPTIKITPHAAMKGKKYESKLQPGMYCTVTDVVQHSNPENAFLYAQGNKKYRHAWHVLIALPDGTPGAQLMANIGYPIRLFKDNWIEIN